MGLIYCIRNIINGKCYIGQTTRTFNERYRGGKWWKYTKNRYLLSSYDKYGAGCFITKIMSLSDAAKDIGVCGSSISESIRERGGFVMGYQFAFGDYNEFI